MKKKILICGSSGFIGRNIAQQLADRDDVELYGTYLQSEPEESDLDRREIIYERVDFTDRRQAEKIIKGKDVVIQAAAVTTGIRDVVNKPYIHVTDNAIMNSIIFRECFENRIKHVVFFSCTTMYPSQKHPIAENDFNGDIVDKYFGVGWTKVYIEKLCEFYSTISDTKFTAIRHSNIYGPFDKYDLERSHVFGATVTKVLTSKDNELEVWGDGREKRDLLYVSDLTDFVELVIEKQVEPFELINIGYGNSITIHELVKKVIEISGRDIKITFDGSKPTIDFSLTLNIDRAKNNYGWSPKVSLEEGISKTVLWYRENIGNILEAGIVSTNISTKKSE